MARRSEADTENTETQPDPTAERPAQGLTIAYLNAGDRSDFHRYHYGRAGVPDVRRIDPASLRNDKGHDPFLRSPSGGILQVRADHAAELLECDEVTGGESKWRLATDAEVEAYKKGGAK